MHLSPWHLVVVGLAASSVSANVVSVPFVKRNLPRPSLIRRDTLSLWAANNVTAAGYFAQLGIGTPPQILNFHIDTGSSDTWVNSVGTAFCRGLNNITKSGSCSAQFMPTKSSTFEMVTPDGFNIRYLDDTKIAGDLFSDSVLIDGVLIRNQQLGLALETESSTGIMGLGLSAGVSGANKYPTIIDNMVSQGHIASPAFSLYLDDLAASKGVILFGGVDTDKYVDDLAILPIQTLPGQEWSTLVAYAVQLDGIGLSGTHDNDDDDDDDDDHDDRQDGTKPLVAVLDSGSTISLLPHAVVKQIWAHFGVFTFGSMPPLVDCRHAKIKGTVDFRFGSKIIRVPYDQIIIDLFAADLQQEITKAVGSPNPFKGWQRICLFGFGSTKSVVNVDFVLLGDTFLRSAYVVYDAANSQIGIAQASHNSSRSNIVALNKELKLNAVLRSDAVSRASSLSRAVGPVSSLVFAAAIMSV